MKRSVYRRSREGVWVRATSCSTDGVIRLQHQPVVKHTMGIVTVLGLRSHREEPFTPSSETLTRPWSEGACLSLDEAPFPDLCLSAGVNRMTGMIQGVLNHASGLFASGYGEDEAEVLSWFKDLRSLEFVESSMKYEVIAGHPPVNFLESGPVRLAVRGDAIDCTFLVEQEHLTVEVTHNPDEWALMAATPVVE